MIRHRFSNRRPRRAAFTLLEVVLATAIGVLLMAAVYVALDMQLRHVQAGRDVVEQNLVARSLLSRMTSDISCHLGPTIPNQNQGNSSGGGGAAGSTGGSSSSPTPGTSSSTTGSSTGSSTSSTSTTSSTTSSTATTSSSAINSPNGPVQFNLWVQGDNTHLALYVSRVPREAYLSITDPANPNAQQVVSDLRRITYWLAGSGDSALGLARQEIKLATSDDALNAIPPNDGSDEAAQVIAEEIKSLEFSYFDGMQWQTSWDGTTTASDGVTPIGPPMAIKITIGVAAAKTNDPHSTTKPDLKYFSHVVALPTANGVSLQQQGLSNTPQQGQ